MKTVFLFLADGFEEIEALATVDVLRRAGVQVTTVSINPTELVIGAHGIPVMADVLFEQAQYADADMLILPGGMPGAANLDAHEGLRRLITAHAEAGKWLAAICAAPMVYGHMGLLSGRKATCYPGFEEELKGAAATGEGVVTDGQFITSKGLGTAIDFSLELITLLVDAETADHIAKAVQYK